MQVLYGGEGDIETQMVMLARAQHGVAQLLPGMWLVQFFPILQYLPTWFPGPGGVLPRMSKMWMEAAVYLRDEPFDQARQDIVSVPEQPAWPSRLKADI